MTKIIFGINVPYKSTEIDWEATEKKRKERGESFLRDWVWVPCIRYKELSFEICDACGNQVTKKGRLSRGITTCSPPCNAKKWDSINGIVIEKERNQSGIRPASFWQTISGECFERDNFTCQVCKKTSKELKELEKSEQYLDAVFVYKYPKHPDLGFWEGTKRNPNYKGDDYILNCHHIKSIKDGGNNKLENLITLCGKCHKIEHSRATNIRKLHKPLQAFIGEQ